jgi:hypothetical protein
VVALVVCAGTVCFAQSSAATGSLTGKFTDLHSTPLGGVAVVLRNQATGAEARATTQKNGTYRFAALAEGDYTLVADSPQLGRGQLEGIVVAQGHEAHVQSALRFELPPPAEVAAEKIDPERIGGSPTKPAESAGPIQAAEKHPLTRSVTGHDFSRADTTPAIGKALPVVPEPVLIARRLPEPATEKPQTVSPVLNAWLAAEPVKTLPLPSKLIGALGPEANLSANLNGLKATSTELSHSAAFQANPALAMTGIGATQAAIQAAIDFAASPLKPVHPSLQVEDPVSPAVTTTVSGEQLQALPSTGRRWQDFVLETPSASTQAGGEGQVSDQVSLRGAAQQPAAVTVDGANRRLAFGGGGGGWARGRGAAISEAAIREVQTVAGNVEAAASRSAGGRVKVETRSGANGLHGQAFLFDRQNTWGAKNPFTQWVKETAPATFTTSPVFTPEAYTPSDREMKWGLGLGSHIRRNKLFWFAALDGYQRNDPGLASVKHPDQFFAHPSNDQMQVLSARLGLSNLNPVAAGLEAYSKMLESLGGLLGPAPRRAGQWTGFGRIDWKAAERHSFTLEGTGAAWDSPGGGLTRASEVYGSHSFGSSQATEEWILGRWEAFLTPNLLAVTQASMGRTVQGGRAETPSAYEQTLTQAAWGQLPEITVDNRYGFTIGNPSRFGAGSYPDERFYQAQETVDWVRGSVLIKAGLDVSHNTDWTTLLRNQTGTYSYANVENFVSDALTFASFGLAGQLDPTHQHNCDQTGRVWHDAKGQLRGLGYLPCYSYYSQTMGPSDWHLSTNDWAAFATTQWQPKKVLVLSAGLRWEREQLPPPITALNNPELPQTQKMPSLGNNWGPRLSLAWGTGENHWPVLRVGYGMYFGRTQNATLETALTQTGSPNGDLNFFMRPTDNLNAGGAPPFPYVLAGEPGRMVKPGAVEFAPAFHNPEIHQAVTAIEETLPGHLHVTASALLSLGRRLPIVIDANIDPAVNPGTITYAVVDGTGKGPIKTPEITVPFYASWPSATSATGFGGRLNPNYQQIAEISSRANSTYEAAMLKVARYGRRGLSMHANYTYAHAMDWNPNETSLVTGSDPLDPAQFAQEYGVSNLDVRHSATATVIWEAPWKLHNLAGRIGNGWMVSSIGHFRSGMPYSMRTSGTLAKVFDTRSGAAIVALGPGMNGSGGDNRVYGVGRNTYRYPLTWKADLRLAKRFNLGQMRQLELLAESFNLFNHQNVTELETVGYTIGPGNLNGAAPTLNFLTGLKTDTVEFGKPRNINAINFYRERQVQIGVRVRF